MKKPIEKSLEEIIIDAFKKHPAPKRVHDLQRVLKMELKKTKELSSVLEKMLEQGKIFSKKSDMGKKLFFLEEREEKDHPRNVVPSREPMEFKPFNVKYYDNVMRVIEERRLV